MNLLNNTLVQDMKQSIKKGDYLIESAHVKHNYNTNFGQYVGDEDGLDEVVLA